ncbi:MAG: hypothetical protein ABFS24_15170 [Pseudomonadota bacterium]
MTSIVVKDLREDAELDSSAMSALTGGYRSGFGWIRTFESTVGSFNPPVVKQYFTFNQFNQYVADVIQINNQEQNVSIFDSPGATVALDADAKNGFGNPHEPS